MSLNVVNFVSHSHAISPLLSYTLIAGSTAEGSSTSFDVSTESNNDNINNLTYTVALNNVPSGHHRLVIYAHNPVGWSPALKDPALQIRVINASNGFHVSVSLLVISFLFTFLGSNVFCCRDESSKSAKL
jgi:hypothetical protein